MKTTLSVFMTILCLVASLAYTNTASASLIYSDQFEATNDPLVVGYQFYWVGHYAEEEYLATNLFSANSMVIDLDVRDLPSISSFDLEFLLNGTVIGGFNTASLTTSINELVFNFAEIESATSNWIITMRVATDACSGCGSLWLQDLHSFSLGAPGVAVREPSTLAILSLALIGFGFSARRFR